LYYIVLIHGRNKPEGISDQRILMKEEDSEGEEKVSKTVSKRKEKRGAGWGRTKKHADENEEKGRKRDSGQETLEARKG